MAVDTTRKKYFIHSIYVQKNYGEVRQLNLPCESLVFFHKLRKQKWNQKDVTIVMDLFVTTKKQKLFCVISAKLYSLCLQQKQKNNFIFGEIKSPPCFFQEVSSNV